MFRRTLILSGTLLLATTTLLIAYLIHITKADYTLYEEILYDSDPSKWSKQSAAEIGHQDRKLVDKQIWIQRDNERLFCRLKAASSQLRYSLSNENVGLVEDLNGVYGQIQEELFYRLPDGREALPGEGGRLLLRGSNPLNPEGYISSETPGLESWQQIHIFEADNATYTYKAKQLVAQNCTIKRYILPGHRIPEDLDHGELLMRGIAHTVSFTLEDENPLFHAQNMRTSIYSERGLL